MSGLESLREGAIGGRVGACGDEKGTTLRTSTSKGIEENFNRTMDLANNKQARL